MHAVFIGQHPDAGAGDHAGDGHRAHDDGGLLRRQSQRVEEIDAIRSYEGRPAPEEQVE